MKKILFLAVILMMIISSCTAPVEVIPTNEVTAVLEETGPVCTEIGNRLNRFTDVLGWDVVTCDSSIVEEDWDKGVFRYREDVDYYFCGYDGYSSEPVLQPTETNYQYVLSLTLRGGTDFKTILLFMMFGLDARYYIPYPSEITAINT